MRPASLMTGALATPVMGRLADGPFKRRVIEVVLCLVLLGCVLSAVSTTFLTMVIGRSLQGVGLGLLPVTKALARSHLSSEKAARAIATLSVTGAVGAGIGYPVTALIAQAFDFRAAFWFGTIAVAVALVLVASVLPGRSDAVHGKLDLVGLATLGLAVVGLVVVLSEGGSWGWTSPLTLGLFAGCVVSTGLLRADPAAPGWCRSTRARRRPGYWPHPTRPGHRVELLDPADRLSIGRTRRVAPTWRTSYNLAGPTQRFGHRQRPRPTNQICQHRRQHHKRIG